MNHLELGAGGLAVLSLALAPALASPAANTKGPALDMKCGPQPEGTVPLIAVDGEILDLAPEERRGADALDGIVDRDDMFWLQIVCMDARDSTFRRRGTGLPVISLWTKQGPAGQMAPALAELAEAQDRHFERRGRYIDELADIEAFELPARVEIELAAEADWWVATARTERFLGQCTTGGGTSVSYPPEPECDDDR